MTLTLSAPLVRLLMVRVAAEEGVPIAAVKTALALLEDRGYVRTERDGETDLLAKAFTRRTPMTQIDDRMSQPIRFVNKDAAERNDRWARAAMVVHVSKNATGAAGITQLAEALESRFAVEIDGRDLLLRSRAAGVLLGLPVVLSDDVPPSTAEAGRYQAPTEEPA